MFASVITGNLVVLGISAARGDRTGLVDAGCALGGYALGVLAAAPSEQACARGVRTPWPPGTTVWLLVEGCLLAVFAVGWELSSHPGRGLALGLLVVLAGAMGIQSVAVRRLGAISTTYLTGALTSLLEAARARTWSPDESRDVGILAAAVIGAAAALELIDHARGALPALQLVPLTIVLVRARRRRTGPPPATPSLPAAHSREP